MRDKRGAIKVITIVELILIIILLMYAKVIFTEFSKEKKDDNGTNLSETNNKNISSNVEEFPILKLESNKTNMIYSPLSIKYVLKMLQDGAENYTYDEIQSVIGNLNIPIYKNVENKIAFANGMFVRDTYSQFIKQEYIDNIKNTYSADYIIDSFENANNINNWVNEKTFGIIPSILDDNLITESSKEIFLINTIALDVEWKENFPFAATKESAFKKYDGTEMKATMMALETTSENVKYYEGKNITAVSIDMKPEEDIELEFLAIEPKENLGAYINDLKLKDINNITKKLEPASETKNGIKVEIPKFSFDYSLNLKNDLIKMGIEDVFDKDIAKLNKMADLEKTGSNLYVTDALQKTDIKFSETGIKAATVTEVGIADTALSSISEAELIKFNKPFLFLIRDKTTNEIWLMGTVYEPNSWSDDMSNYNESY